MFYLAQLHGAHAAAVGSEFSIRMLIELYQQILGSRRSESAKKFFFEDGEGTLQRFQILSRCVLRSGGVEFGCKFTQAGCGCGSGFWGDCRRIQSCGGSFKMRWNAVLLKARLAGDNSPGDGS